MWRGANISFVFLIVLLIILWERFQICNGGQDKQAVDGTGTEGCNKVNELARRATGGLLRCMTSFKRTPSAMSSPTEPEEEKPFDFKETNQIIDGVPGYISQTVILDVEISNENKNTFKLKLFRIKDAKAPDVKNKPAVLLMHGCMASSSNYVFGEKESGLGFHLVDSGYDVWLGNFRGNVFAGLNEEKDPLFWDFSFHEMGMHDLPAQIDHILQETGQKKLFYIGLSMGTTAAYVMLSSLPEYNKKIERMICLGPVVYLETKISEFIQTILIGVHGIVDVFSAIHRKKMRSYWRGPVKYFKTPKCYKKSWKKFCLTQINKHSSSDESLINPELREKFFNVAPAGGSVKTLAHYSKVARTGKFIPLTYVDEKKNIVEYHGGKAPPYQLEKVTVPTLMFLGKKDELTNEKILEKLMKALTGIKPELLHKKFVNSDSFMHMDFSLAKNLKTLAFEPIVQYLITGKP